jgi:hypothetical protein
MKHELDKADDNENLKEENDFLKMKMMLEHGAVLEMGSSAELPADLENQFLKNVMEFEKQWAEQKEITVFEKIGKPGQFRPVNEIEDKDVDMAWNELSNYLSEHGIDLSACSPNVTNRELYRFTVEELFQKEMTDINVPGMMSCFIYDEFYPDHVYDNTRHAIEDCIENIFEKQPLDFITWFAQDNITLNARTGLTQSAFKETINRFKDIFDEIELTEVKSDDCRIEDTSCKVTGSYKSKLVSGGSEARIKGGWLVEYFLDDLGYWEICNVQIEGVDF